MSKIKLNFTLIIILLTYIYRICIAKGNEHGMDVGIVEIQSVSTRREVENFDPQGSIVGGAMVYLRVKNHSMTPSLNKVFIGPYPCIIAEKGISENLISCMTTPQTEPDRFWELPVELHVYQKVQSVCTSKKGKCVFTYSRGATPYLKYIAPNAGSPNQKIVLNALWRVENTNEIKKIRIGDDNCNRFELEQPREKSNPSNLNDDTSIKKGQFQNVQCQLSKEQVAGLYNTQFETSYGDLYKYASSTHITVDGQKEYQFTIIGEINALNTNSGGENGNELIIEGKGFGNKKGNVEVKVGDLQCQIKSINNNKVTCDLQSGITLAPQANQFISGQGARLTKYKLSAFKDNQGNKFDDSPINNPQKLREAIQENNIEQKRVLEDYIIGSWESVHGDDVQEEKKLGIFVRGYIKAPRTGKYGFWIANDEIAQVFLNINPRNTTIDYDENLILDKCGYTYPRDYFNPKQCGDYKYETQVDLQEGEYYWVELYTIDNSQEGHFTLSVETPEPSDGSLWKNAMDGVYSYQIVSDKDNEQWSIKMFNSQDPFQFSFRFVDPKTRKIIFNPKSGEKIWQDWDPSDLAHSVNQMLNWNYDVQLVESFKLDAQGERCGQDCEVNGKEIIIEFQNIRPKDGKFGQDLKCSQDGGSCKLQKIQEASPGFSGTFQIQVEWETKGQTRQEFIEVWQKATKDRPSGWYRDIPVEYSIQSIKSGLARLDSIFEDVVVSEKYNYINGKLYQFDWRSDVYKGMVPKLTFNLHSVEGGKGLKQIQEVEIVQPSKRPFYEPIPFDMSYIQADKPQVSVIVNGIVSQCKQGQDCSYQTDSLKTPVINSFSESNKVVTIDLSTPLGVTVEDLQIQYGGYECIPTNSNLAALTCNVEGIEAGDNVPIVLVKNIGYASTSNPTQTQSIVIDNISPAIGSVNGGQVITINGSGFPANDIYRAIVKFGNQKAEVKKTSYSQMVVVLPQSEGQVIGNQPLSIAYNNQISNNDVIILYKNANIATITSVEIQDVVYNHDEHIKSSPVKKQQIKIIGTNFKSVKEDISVWLLELIDGVWVQKYEVNVNTLNPQGTQIVATLSGGRVGEYQLRVYHSQHGYSLQSVQFSYIIEILGISKTSGPKQGGQKLVITGVNFSKVSGNNQVFFEQDGGNVAKLAYIESEDHDEIVVRIPSMDSNGDINKPWQITVFGRLIEQAVCLDQVNNCEFTYLDGIQTPMVTIQGTVFVVNGQWIGIEGMNLPTSSDSAKAIIEGYGEIQLLLDTTENFGGLTVPQDIQVGIYPVEIKLESYGVIGSFYMNVKFEIVKVLTDYAISQAGGDIEIQGSGFTQDSQVVINGKDCIVRSVQTNQIICTAAPEWYGNYNLVVYNKNLGDVCNDCVQFSIDQTPVISETIPLSKNSEQVVSDSTFTYRVEVYSGIQSGDIQHAYLQSVYDPRFRIKSSNVQQDGNAYKIEFQQVVAGKYEILIQISGKGYAQIRECEEQGCDGAAKFLTFTMEDSKIISGGDTGLAGGTELVLEGKGFNSIIEELNEISVCGHECKIIPGSVKFDLLKCRLPKVNTKYVFDEDYEDQEEQVQDRGNRRILVQQSSSNNNIQKYFKAVYTSETSNENVVKSINRGPVEKRHNNPNEFWIEFHVHENTKIFIDTIVLNPGLEFNLEEYFYNVKFQARNSDQDPWLDLDVFDPGHLSEYQEVNLQVKQTDDQAENNRKNFINAKSFKQFRIIEEQQQGTPAFGTLFVKKIVGDIFYEQEIAADQDFQCSVIVNVNDQFGGIESEQKINYLGSVKTPRVFDISPSFSTFQGSQIVINGEKFGNQSNKLKIFVKGQECTIAHVSDDRIEVQVPAYSPIDGSKNIEITFDGVPVLFKKGIIFFPGALLWSHEDTWGGENPPDVGNFVFVPKGQTLVVDQNTPKPLKSVIVEGTLLFDPDLELDLEFDVMYMIIRKGQLIVGSEIKPYRSKLTFTLHGNFWDKQLPEYGNKVIGCHNCQLDLHGLKRGPHYAILDQTVDIGDEQMVIDREVDWQVGELIGLATTDFDGGHSEQLTITQITNSQGKSTIQFSPKLRYKHLSEQEQFGSKTLKVKAEVVYLSSNLVIQGNPQDSINDRYGGHLMVHGRSDEGTLARIENVEFRYTGQPRIVGRYSCHFHMLGDSPNTYVRNIKVHDAFARVVAIHATSHLRVQNNVGFMVPGHNIFLEDAVETNNLIEHNVLISPRSAFTMLQTDITVAGIWVTNPSNYVRYNIIAGSEFYGMWYEIKKVPESRIDFCPHGMPVLQLDHNIGHSCQRFGLRYFHLKPRKFPCRDIRDDSLEDPFQQNPSVKYIYHNQTSYKNGESGILAEYLGDCVFQDCIMADNYRAGFQAHVSNYTSSPVTLKDSVIIGKSTINGEVVDYTSSAILTPRTDGFYANNVEIYNMPNNTNVIESSSENFNNRLWTQGGYENKFDDIKVFDSPEAGKMRWQGPRANMIQDHDGKITGTNQATWITPYYPHFDRFIQTGGCSNETREYDDSVVCTVPVRAVRISNFQPKVDFKNQVMRIFDLQDKNKTYDIEASMSEFGIFGDLPSVSIKNPANDGDGAYIALLPVNSVYNIHWNQGIDFDHILVWPSYETQEDDLTTVLRFPYSEQRELFEVFRMVTKKNVKQYHSLSNINKFFDPQTFQPNNSQDGCVNGDWLHDVENKYFYLCLNGKSRDGIKFQQIDINAIYCRDTCESGGFTCDKEQKVRNFMEPQYLHNATYLDKDQGAKAMARTPGQEEWEYRVPQEGDDVRIPCEWTMKFNVDSFRFNNLFIDGTLRIEESSAPKKQIMAANIWVRGGKLAAGIDDDMQRFKQKLEIILTGDKESEPLLIDDISRTGSKTFAVTGQLELYGVVPQVTRTRLSKIANPGDTEIFVQDDIADWKIGDELALGANQFRGTGFEKVKIIGKDDLNRSLTLESPIQYWHYGHEHPTVSSSSDAEVTIEYYKYGGGSLDLRTPVGHLTRNIKIMGEKEGTDWGGHLLIYQYIFQDEKTQVDINARGNAILQGVEFENMGKRGTDSAGLHVFMTKGPIGDDEEYRETLLKGSSIHDCVGMCVNIFDGFKVMLENNVIFNGRKFLIQSLGSQSVKILDNYLIGLLVRHHRDIKVTKQWEPCALIHMYESYLPIVDDLQVIGNVGSGSEGIGYAFPGTPCDEKDQIGFRNNEVGYCAKTGVMFNNKENRCYNMGHVSVHNCIDGVTLNTKHSEEGYRAEFFLIAECHINLKLHTGSTAKVHNSFLKNSWISAVARPNCQECYTEERLNSGQSKCKNGSGIQLHVTTEGGESFPWDKDPFIYDVICVPPIAFGSSFIEDVELHMYKNEYNQNDHPYLTECKNNRGFRNHRAAADATAGTYLTNVKCTQCEKNGHIYIMEPRESWRGWFGGCGQFDCTGLENMLIQDLTGDLLGHKGTIVSNNEDITMSEGMRSLCTYYKEWNAYDCATTDFGVLEWDAESDDKQKLHPVPVYVTNDKFTNKVNLWREWEWIGNEPMNLRLNRYVSLILANQVHNITYSGTKCTNIMHKLQQRTPYGENDRYIVVKYHYSNPLALEVAIKGQVVPPWPLNNPGDLVKDNKTDCGANNYFFDNSTIHFIITNEPQCQVNVYQKNYLHVNLRLKVTPEEFFEDDNKVSSFINIMAAYLKVDFSQIRIVGVKSYGRRLLNEEGSEFGTELSFIVLDKIPSVEDYDPKGDFIRMKEVGDNIQKGLEDQELELGFEVQFSQAAPKVIKEIGIDYSQEDKPFMTEQDLIDAPDGGDGGDQRPGNNPQSQNPNSNLLQRQKEEKESMVSIALGVIFGIIAAIIVAMLGYHFWKKKQLIKVQNIALRDNASDFTVNEKKIIGNNNQLISCSNSRQNSHSDLNPNDAKSADRFQVIMDKSD